MTEKTNTPIYKVRAGVIEASVWLNINKKDGKEFRSFSTTWSRSYKDKDGNWQTTSSLMTSDIPKLMELLRQCYAWIISQKAEE